jgi:hypothetical protein
MPSRALVIWESEQQIELDRLETAVGGAGRRAPGPHLGDAYIVLLAAHFQAFCRDLHTEAADAIAASTPHASLVKKAFQFGRHLDRGNATPGALGADYGRLGIELWPSLTRWDWRTPVRRRRLEQLNVWRNAVAHHDFHLSASARATVAGTRRSLTFVRSCRVCCQVLARQFDAVVEMSLWGRLGRRPW